MTPRSPLDGTTLSRGRINDSIAQFILFRKKLRGLFGRLKAAQALTPALSHPMGEGAIAPTLERNHCNRLASALLFCALLAGCDSGNYSRHVELVTGSPNPEPGMTFELRFDSTMIKGDAVGTEATKPAPTRTKSAGYRPGRKSAHRRPRSR